ncbi:MAG: Kelch repeat-containing protein [Anaerolineae bacterium]
MAAEEGEPLTERELEITELVAEGLTNREVAERLYLSHNTVKVHLRNIFVKTGVASRTELSMLAVQERWITVPGVTEEMEPGSADRDLDGSHQPVGAERTGTRSRLPRWPWQRWASVAFGLLLALTVLILPQRRSTPTVASGPGDIFGSSSTIAEIPELAVESGWQELAPLPVRRAGMAVAAMGEHLYVIGGMSDSGPSSRVDIYDTAADAWREGADRPVALSNVSAVALENEILVPAGCDSDWIPDAISHRYLSDEDTWTEAAPLPNPLCAYAVTAYGGRAFVFGGWDGEAFRAHTYVYDPEADEWEELAPPSQARGFGAAAALADRIFYLGGYDGNRERATCEVYFPETDTWDTCPSMLQPRGGLGAVAIGGRIYAIGGGWQTPLGFNERYTPATDQWSVMETPIVGEWRNLGAAPSETSIYVVGGWSGTDFLNRTYAIEVMPWRVFIPGAFRSP